MNDERKRGFAIKPEKLALINKKVTEKGYSHEKLAELAQLSTSTISKTLCGKNQPQRKTIEAIAQALSINVTDIVDANELYDKSQTVVQEQISPDWHLVCSKMLKKQQENQRLRSKATERGFEVNIDDVHLGLVERKQQQRRRGNIEAKQLNQLEAEVIAKIYQHDEFLQRFTEQNQGSENRHTAIIGEAGVGKTTLLSKIASYIEEKTDNLFVFISLSNLEDQNLHEYLLKQWLSEAMGVSDPELDVTPEIENKFIKRFRQGSVWLLLDGVDEMSNATPLHSIKSELTGWLNQVRVVLTCRNNVWDASVNNGMTGFDTFKAQDFKPKQVNQFIENWFDDANDKQQGDLLKAKLQEPGRERIRDLVRNPLRLSLLCQTFYFNKADLPETKAALYKRFVLYLQEWKQGLHTIDRQTQDDLHKALGKLALAGINSETKFRFRESVARQEMGDSLFELARDVIWLHQVHRDTQTDEPVFAFFHPNFQEYFAALAILDWSYFLNHVPHDPKQGTYRIFEQQWKEVILLWLGRDDVEKYNKEKFINALIDFNDNCGDNYKFQAFFLAAAGISEFKEYRQADEIVKFITELSFGTFNAGDNKYFKFISSIESGARSALLQTDRTKALKALEKILTKLKGYPVSSEVESFLNKLSLQSTKIAQEFNIKDYFSLSDDIEINTLKEYQGLQAIQKSRRKDPSNQKVIEDLIDLVQKTQEFHIFSEALKALEEISLANPKAKSSLVQLMQDKSKGYICLEAAKILAKTAPEYKDCITITILDLFIDFDIKFISPSWIEYDEYTESIYYSEFECLLAETAVDNLKVIEALIQLLPTGQDYCWRIPSILGKIAFAKEEAIIKLKQLFQSSHDDTTSYLAANSLLQVDPMNLDAIHALTRIVESAQDQSIRQLASEELWQMGQGNTNVLNTLIEKVCDSSLGIEYRNYTWSILCTKHDNNPDTINPMINMMLDSNCNKEARYLTIRELEEMGVDNLLVRDAFSRLMNTETDEDIRRQAANTWIKINPDKQEAINTTVDVLTILLKSPNRDDYTRLRTAQCLEKIVPNHLDSTKAMIDLLLNSNKWEEQDWDEDYYLPSIVKTAAKHLEKIHDKEKLIFI